VPSLVLLNEDGVVLRKLQLVSLPDDFQIPPGTIVSWQIEELNWHIEEPVFSAFDDNYNRLFVPPQVAYFCLGSARAQVFWREPKREGITRGARPVDIPLSVTVQGTVAKDIMDLRGQIIHLISTQTKWLADNDLNPEPQKPCLSFRRRLRRRWFGDKGSSKAVPAV